MSGEHLFRTALALACLALTLAGCNGQTEPGAVGRQTTITGLETFKLGAPAASLRAAGFRSNTELNIASPGADGEYDQPAGHCYAYRGKIKPGKLSLPMNVDIHGSDPRPFKGRIDCIRYSCVQYRDDLQQSERAPASVADAADSLHSQLLAAYDPSLVRLDQWTGEHRALQLEDEQHNVLLLRFDANYPSGSGGSRLGLRYVAPGGDPENRMTIDYN